jgi:hypothetical protein
MTRPTTSYRVDIPASAGPWVDFAASADRAKRHGEHLVGDPTDYIHRASGLERPSSLASPDADSAQELTYGEAEAKLPDTEAPEAAWKEFVGLEARRQPGTTTERLGATALQTNTA